MRPHVMAAWVLMALSLGFSAGIIAARAWHSCPVHRVCAEDFRR